LQQKGDANWLCMKYLLNCKMSRVNRLGSIIAHD
jgi:hypothetical protein